MFEWTAYFCSSDMWIRGVARALGLAFKTFRRGSSQPSLTCEHCKHVCKHYKHVRKHCKHVCKHCKHVCKHCKHVCKHCKHGCKHCKHVCKHCKHVCKHCKHVCKHCKHVCISCRKSCRSKHLHFKAVKVKLPKNSYRCLTTGNKFGNIRDFEKITHLHVTI